KMPGDPWQRFANLRLLLAYMFTRPGKKLLFMGTEIAPWDEWRHDASLDWHLLGMEPHAQFKRFVERLGHMYAETRELWRDDPNWNGFTWLDVSDHANSVMSYARGAGLDQVVVVLNLTPVPREKYRIGVPTLGVYKKLLSSDDAEFGGSGFGAFDTVRSDVQSMHGYGQSVELTLPPLGAAPARRPRRHSSRVHRQRRRRSRDERRNARRLVGGDGIQRVHRRAGQ